MRNFKMIHRNNKNEKEIAIAINALEKERNKLCDIGQMVSF